jgi:sulfur carrier protein ThiS
MVNIIYRNKQWQVRAGMTVRDAIEKVGLNPETVLAVRNGKLINEAVLLEEGDEVKLVAVISGGTSQPRVER